jgi:hypothetical protein
MTDQEAQSDTVDSPFVFLAPQFDWAFSETAPGEGLPRLSQRFSESVFFAPPEDRSIRKLLPLGTPAADLILVELGKARDEEFYLMLAEADGIMATVPSEDRTKVRSDLAA